MPCETGPRCWTQNTTPGPLSLYAKGPQLDDLRRKGVHAVVATPGRLKDFLESRQVRLGRCSYFCLDEGDRMLDLGFDEEVHKVMNHFEAQRQTLLFSATMPQKFQDFARGALVRSVLVNVSRAGAANLDVIQEVEYRPAWNSSTRLQFARN